MDFINARNFLRQFIISNAPDFDRMGIALGHLEVMCNAHLKTITQKEIALSMLHAEAK